MTPDPVLFSTGHYHQPCSSIHAKLFLESNFHMQRYIKQEMQEARVQEQEKDGFRVTLLYTGALSVVSVA